MEVNAIQDNYGIDIGNRSLQNNNNVIVEPHHSKDIDISSSRELFLKFNSGDKSDYPYYLFLLIDGHLVNAFGEKTSVKCYSVCGTKSFQYQIPKSLIPNNGVHFFQAVAIPCGITENIIAVSSVRVRVQC